MGSTNHGDQNQTYNYFEEATAKEFNKKDIDIRPRGIYKGGYLTRVTDSEITLSPFTAEIGDSDVQVAIKTSALATLNNTTLDSGSIASGTPYIIFRWAYSTSSANYLEVHAIATTSAALTNDIIVGKCNFSGGVLVDFDYTDRTFLNVQDLFLKVETSSGLYVQLRNGRIHTSSGYVVVSETKVGPFSVLGNPNSRIDLLYIDSDGTPTILEGSAAVSPSAPSYAGKIVVAEITIVNGDISIPASQIKDVRSFIPNIPDNVTIESASGKLQVKAGGIGSSQVGSLFGAWTTKSNNTSYLAATDGFVCAYSPSSLLATQRLMGYTDSNNPPTTKRLDTETGAIFQTSPTLALTMPVRKGDYWKVTGATKVYWLPMGS